MSSEAATLITFDPGDALKKEAKFESYPFAIADYEGTADFWINDDFNQCGSMNYMNGGELGGHVDEIKKWYEQWEGSKCRGPAKRNWDQNNAFRCMFPKKSHYAHGKPVRRLSNFLRERGVTQINVLQIDSQGSDFTILKDVIKNYGTRLSVQTNLHRPDEQLCYYGVQHRDSSQSRQEDTYMMIEDRNNHAQFWKHTGWRLMILSTNGALRDLFCHHVQYDPINSVKNVNSLLTFWDGPR